MASLDPRLKSKAWRLLHLYKIKNKDGDLITFRPNAIQLRHIEDRGNHRYNVILKARQFGLTTEYAIDYLDETLWVPGTASAIIAHERVALEKIFEIVKRAYENLPDGIKPRTKAENVNEYSFTHRYDGAILDSVIYVALKIRSGTVQNLHITESAYIKNRQELVAGSKQAVPLSGRISEETTANGYNDFYDFFMQSYKNPTPGEMDYKAHFYAWVENPEYTLPGGIEDEKTAAEIEIIKVAKELYNIDVTDGMLAWRRWKVKELKANTQGFGLSGEQLFKQEYPLTISEAFQSGAGSVFDLEKVDMLQPSRGRLYANLEAEWLQKEYNPDRLEVLKLLTSTGTSVWDLPEPNKEYVVGVDPSDGQGADFGVIDVWARPTPEGQCVQVAQFYGKLLPDKLAEMAQILADFYNNAFAGVENNMISTILFLSKIYDNIYYTTKFDEKFKRYTKKLGWNTNIQSREKMIDDFIIHFDAGLLTIRSAITMQEMRTFIKKQMNSGAYKREHADGKFDDALFAGFIAIQMTLFRPPEARGFATKPVGW